MELSGVTSMIERFLAELESIYEEGIGAGKADLGWERLDRWKRRVSRFLAENVSDEEAHALQDGVDDLTDLGEEIDRCKNSLVALLEELGAYPDMVIDRSVVRTAPAPQEAGKTGWDAFVCHASEDKDDFVRPLVEALVRRELRVWYDEFTLSVGDRLRQSIDRGLAASTYGIVVISPNFLAKNWPQWELDGLVTREVGGRKVILPVWHNIDAEAVRQYSPMLADRVAVLSSHGLDHVVKGLMRAMQPPGDLVGVLAPPLFQRKERGAVESQELDDLQELLSSRFSDARRQGFSQLETLAYSKRIEDCAQLLEVLERTIANDNIEVKLSAIRVFFPILTYADTGAKQKLVQRYVNGFLGLLDVHVATELRHEAIRIAQLIPDAGIVSLLILILHNEPEEDYGRQSPHPAFRSLKAMEGMRKEILSRLRREAASTLNSVARQRLLKCMEYIQRG